MEVDPHPAVLVDVDLLARGPDHGGALHPLDARLGRGERRAIGRFGADGGAGMLPGAGERAGDRRGHDEQPLVRAELALGVIDEGEDGAGRRIEGVGLEQDLSGRSPLGLEPALRQGPGLAVVRAVLALVVSERVALALVALVEEGAGHVVEALEPLFHRGRRSRRGEELLRRRPAVIVVSHRVLARPDAAPDADGGHVLEARVGGVITEGDRRPGLVRLRPVVEHEPTLPLAVEIVAHAGVLQHAAEERVVGLAVLDSVLALAVDPAEPQDRGDSPLGEDLPRDLHLRHLLEDAVIAALGGEPERGDEGELVGREVPFLDGCLVELAAHAGPDARRRPLDGEAHRLTDDRLEVDVWVVRDRDQPDLEEG